MSTEPHTGGQKDNYVETDLLQRIEHLRQLDLCGMEYTEYINNNCNYYTNEKYNNNCFTEDKLTIVHFNSRSLYTNFNAIRENLQSFVFPFSVIAISETWFNQEKGIDFEMDDYDLH